MTDYRFAPDVTSWERAEDALVLAEKRLDQAGERDPYDLQHAQVEATLAVAYSLRALSDEVRA